MTPFECPREGDVVAAVLSRAIGGRDEHSWLGGCDDDVRAHVDGCEVCRDAGTVAVLLHADAIAARRDVHVPSSGQVWWRAAIRARADAACEVERPLTWIHGLAGACSAGVIAAAAGAAWPSVERGAAWLASQSWSAPPPAWEAAGLAIGMLQRVLPIALVATACIVLVPLAIYLATADD